MSPTLDAIAAALQGYDPNAMRTEQVHAFLEQLALPLPDSAANTETVGVFQALGRVLAADVVSPINVPAHDNSAMDGYAFHGAALQGGELRLRVAGTALAGAAWRGNVAQDGCVRIMTGAVMPEGLDTVVPQEFTRLEGDTVVFDASAVRPGDNRRLCGEDLRQGLPALRRGQRLGPAALGLIASLGLTQVQVWRRLRVAYFSTGDEILSLGEAAREGAVYDSNRYTVFGLLTRLGVEVLDMGVVRDEPVALRAAFTQAAASADVVITSGGVSVGEADFTKAMMRELGDVAFWKIAMRPGRPMAVGRISQAGALLFGLPGNPVAVMVTFLAFVRPALRRLMGEQVGADVLLRAASDEVLRKKPGRTEYQRAWVYTDAQGRLRVRSTGNQGSGVLRSMAEANGLIVLGHGQGTVAVDDEVQVLMFDGALGL
ncbi:MAG: molybdopterin molybdotransferase MoeA [Rhodoferax sp.]